MVIKLEDDINDSGDWDGGPDGGGFGGCLLYTMVVIWCLSWVLVEWIQCSG